MMSSGAPQRPDSEVSLEAKVSFLGDPENYPGAPETVECLETHLSWVFLTPRYVYKLKKPLHYEFLDFRTLKARLSNCEREIRLNKKLAPDIYLGIVTLSSHPTLGLNLDDKGETVEVLVKMRRLPDHQCLEHQLGQGHVEVSQVDAAANRLARFYAEQPAETPVDPAYLERRIHTIQQELSRIEVDTQKQRKRLVQALLSALASQHEELAQRTTREVHGDLRPQHVYLGQAPLFIDRLEFNRQLRVMDPLEELSFFAMECSQKGAAWIGERFIEAYRSNSAPAFSPELVDFYTGLRALLWALLSARHIPRQDHRKDWKHITNNYLEYGLKAISG
ncbi:hypothetical protein QQM79_02635 [Marinobacteraceae bacterium S3BR75-40.1]